MSPIIYILLLVSIRSGTREVTTMDTEGEVAVASVIEEGTEAGVGAARSITEEIEMADGGIETKEVCFLFVF